MPTNRGREGTLLLTGINEKWQYFCVCSKLTVNNKDTFVSILNGCYDGKEKDRRLKGFFVCVYFGFIVNIRFFCIFLLSSVEREKSVARGRL